VAIITFLVWIAIGVGTVAMSTVAFLTLWIYHEDAGSPEMREVARYIRNGAKAFLKRQYKTILLFVAILSVPLALFFQSLEVVISFYAGAALSLLAAYIGMNVAVRANVRTTKAALKSTERAFNIAFRGGAVMGLSVGGLSLLGISILYLIYGYRDPSLLIVYGFGASLAALFAQLGAVFLRNLLIFELIWSAKLNNSFLKMT
jgi:K(+)-stimulated pyrophosphate-energized sodium pump